MNHRRIRLTATATRQFELERAWWIKNRDHRELFDSQLERTLAFLASLPGLGKQHRKTRVINVRRVLLPKLNCHLFYRYDDDSVTVLGFWGARRGRGPDFGT